MWVIHAQQGRSSLWLQAEPVKSFSNVLLMHKQLRMFSFGGCHTGLSFGTMVEEQMQFSQHSLALKLNNANLLFYISI